MGIESGPEFWGNSSYLERLFFISERDIQSNIEVSPHELLRISYSPERNSLSRVESRQPKRGIEVLWHENTGSLIVPPPNPDKISIADLPVMAAPVVGFIEQTKPDIVIGCDRNARVYGVAVHSLWSKQNNGKDPFPTLDSAMHFARLSTSLSVETTTKSLQKIVDSSMKGAKRLKYRLNHERPRLLFIDDWINSGATRKQIIDSVGRIMNLENIDINFAVMCGQSADISGTDRQVRVPWQDNPSLIGIDYSDNGQVYSLNSSRARKLRSHLHRETRKFIQP
jgi:hypothetical protein